MPDPRGQILVIRGGAIGDFILTLPVLAALRTQFPSAHLTVLGYPHIAGLAVLGGLADAVKPIEARGLAACFNARAEVPAEWAEFFAGFAVILSYLYDPDSVFEQHVRRCTSAVFIAGPHRPAEAGSIHACETFLKPLESLAIFDADPVPRLTPKSAASSGPHERLKLAVHPGSGSERKNWPEANWAELLRRLAGRTTADLLLIGGEAEGERLARLACVWPADRLAIAQSLPLTELALRLAGCAAFVGHDSGITHLAAALGLRGLVLWGDTDPAVWRPRGERMHRLHAPNGLAALEVDRVETELLNLLAGTESPQPFELPVG